MSDPSIDIATWLTLAITGLGLAGLITQASASQDHLAPFRATRGKRELGLWVERQKAQPWYRLVKSAPLGPTIAASMTKGVCGCNDLLLTRLPSVQPGKASWTVLLAVVHPRQDIIPLEPSIFNLPEKTGSSISMPLSFDDRQLGWDHLECDQPLVRYGSTNCTTISRTTLIALLSLTNARAIRSLSGASGYRAAYSCYCGQWYIEWPLGGAAMVRFAPHDSHTGTTDVYPPAFRARVNKSMQMTLGVVESPAPNAFKVAFPGRKRAGRWVLDYLVKGFPGAHGSRHLYNMNGGKVFEVDSLFLRHLEENEESPEDAWELVVPSTEKDLNARIFVPPKESKVLAQAMDCLPWSSLSWSVHRGLRDILVAFAKPTMNTYRQELASFIKQQSLNHAKELIERGWEPDFVFNSFGDMVASAILAGQDNSGDLVRLVTEIASLVWDGNELGLDETTFWRQERNKGSDGLRSLSPEAVVALTKCFVLEWSNEFDYQMYHELPATELLFG